jgi:hypothetical protein
VTAPSTEELARRDRERLARLDRRRNARVAQGLPPEDPAEAEAAVAAIMAAARGEEPPPPPALGQPTERAIELLEGFVRESAERSKAAFAVGNEPAALAAADTTQAAASLLIQLRSTLTGATDAKVLMKRQPTAAQLAMPGRRPVLVNQAAAAVKKTKWAFMDPVNVFGALVAVHGGVTADVLELEHRILHFLANGNLSRDGLQAAAFVSRLVRAGQGAIRAAQGRARPDDQRNVDEMRTILEGFLGAARAPR